MRAVQVSGDFGADAISGGWYGKTRWHYIAAAGAALTGGGGILSGISVCAGIREARAVGMDNGDERDSGFDFENTP